MVSFSITALIYSYSPLVELTLFGRDITAPGNASASEGQGEVVQLPLSDGPRELPKFEQVRTDSSGELLEVKREAEAYGIGTAFAIAIPKIGAYSDVVAQVDINKKEEYLEAMLTGVAHAKQTSYPDEAGITYLFAHSTNSPLYIEQYNAVFYRLRELTIGDNVIVFYKSRRYEYRVIESAVVEVDDTEWVNSDDPTPRLVLQTSHPPGTVWKRLLVIAEPVE
jgi:LPXTG-site transpeptidase (sortase) family protein